MLDYYAARAPEYDRVYLKPERQADLRAIEAWLPPIFAGSHVLEVACGTGYWTRFIAPVAADVLAVDAAAETLRIAGTRIGEGRVRFVVGDAYALPAGEPKCDAAFAGLWLSHVPKTRVREFLDGLGAVLRPGSSVVFLDNRYVEGSSSPIRERDADDNTFQNRSLSDGSVHRVLKNFLSEEELRAAVDGLGAVVEYRAWPYYWALHYRTDSA
ncbi:MAG: methyltransferase domain-containing protein [Pseudomonadota bacterium]|nr:methyltransferase domain-containing protein [Pseudomonadota bacterium]